MGGDGGGLFGNIANAVNNVVHAPANAISKIPVIGGPVGAAARATTDASGGILTSAAAHGIPGATNEVKADIGPLSGAAGGGAAGIAGTAAAAIATDGASLLPSFLGGNGGPPVGSSTLSGAVGGGASPSQLASGGGGGPVLVAPSAPSLPRDPSLSPIVLFLFAIVLILEMRPAHG